MQRCIEIRIYYTVVSIFAFIFCCAFAIVAIATLAKGDAEGYIWLTFMIAFGLLGSGICFGIRLFCHDANIATKQFSAGESLI